MYAVKSPTKQIDMEGDSVQSLLIVQVKIVVCPHVWRVLNAGKYDTVFQVKPDNLVTFHVIYLSTLCWLTQVALVLAYFSS